MSKIGYALITCDRPDFLKKSYNQDLDSGNFSDISYLVVDDGKNSLPFEIKPKNYIQTDGYKGVAYAKNVALKKFLDDGCEHIFLQEDDIRIKDLEVLNRYIKTSKATGILHFNYGLHGNHNLDSTGTPNIRKIVNYTDIFQVDLYSNLLGAFSYYHRKTLEKVGLMDESYYNAMEHVSHTYEIIKAMYHPPFRWFADIHDSKHYIEDIIPDHQQSKIRNNENFQETFKKGLDLFIQQHGFSVVNGYGPQEPEYTEKNCIDALRVIYSKKDYIK